MKAVFADTGYWVAVLNPKDDWNSRALRASSALGKVRFITSEMVLDELLAALSKLSSPAYSTRSLSNGPSWVANREERRGR